MQSVLLSHLLAAFISLDLSNALYHEPLYVSRQWPMIPLLPYSSVFYAPFNNQPRRHEFSKDRLIQRGNIDNRNSQQDQSDAGLQNQNKDKMVIEYQVAQQIRANQRDNTKRFLFDGSTLNNPFWKTATYTSVSTLNVTNIVNCVPQSLFVGGGSTRTCRRKKREIPIEDILQFPTDPSKPQQLTTVTVLPSVDLLMQNNGQQQITIVSSKDEVIPNEERQAKDLNQKKRFFHNLQHYVASTTVYSYILSTFSSQKTLSPLYPGNVNQMLCLLDGYVLC